MAQHEPLLALTPGEPAGIGPECTVRLAAAHPELKLLAVADPDWLQSVAKSLSPGLEIAAWSPGEALMAGRLACYPVRLAATPVPGQPDPANAGYVIECLHAATALIRDGQADALVTGPVHKAVINEAGIPFSGHTEFLAAITSTPRVVMMLACDDLRVALVTTHLPLRAVPDAVSETAVRETIEITHAELRARFGLAAPRLQVLGLNPHAGEAGHLGHEDGEVIAPAIAGCAARGIKAYGPVPADTAFTPRALQSCDAVIAMYHDQGLPVLKCAGFGRAVNVTLGLPMIRTSVDHGTALEIAGRGQADTSSLDAAVQMARRMCTGQRP